MRRRVYTSAVIVALSALTALAQAKPNFAGRWTAVVDPAAPGGGRRGPGMFGQTVTVTQDTKTLTIVRTSPGDETKTVYHLDGSETTNSVMVGGTPVDGTSKTKWDADKLVIDTVAHFGDNPVRTTTVLAIDLAGNLVVQITAPDRSQAQVATTTTYKKG